MAKCKQRDDIMIYLGENYEFTMKLPDYVDQWATIMNHNLAELYEIPPPGNSKEECAPFHPYLLIQEIVSKVIPNPEAPNNPFVRTGMVLNSNMDNEGVKKLLVETLLMLGGLVHVESLRGNNDPNVKQQNAPTTQTPQ